MFKKLFGKVNVPDVIGSGIKEVRSQWGDAFHLIDADNWTDLVEGATLCGNTSWVRAANSSDVVIEEVISASEKKFDSWYYCPKCVGAVRDS